MGKLQRTEGNARDVGSPMCRASRYCNHARCHQRVLQRKFSGRARYRDRQRRDQQRRLRPVQLGELREGGDLSNQHQRPEQPEKSEQGPVRPQFRVSRGTRSAQAGLDHHVQLCQMRSAPPRVAERLERAVRAMGSSRVEWWLRRLRRGLRPNRQWYSWRGLTEYPCRLSAVMPNSAALAPLRVVMMGVPV